MPLTLRWQHLCTPRMSGSDLTASRPSQYQAPCANSVSSHHPALRQQSVGGAIQRDVGYHKYHRRVIEQFAPATSYQKDAFHHHYTSRGSGLLINCPDLSPVVNHTLSASAMQSMPSGMPGIPGPGTPSTHDLPSVSTNDLPLVLHHKRRTAVGRPPIPYWGELHDVASLSSCPGNWMVQEALMPQTPAPGSKYISEGIISRINDSTRMRMCPACMAQVLATMGSIIMN
ncbi:hypothetical protein B0T21DRAFT_51138 [Apiosordaria backusii]|uniref:Uncharacterized protein n=1 Tax=Apiosordaria backusii TaxID=314023 RepID=A0AA40ASV9_9PEZI|nr:hypothetical protein B0T21DRAFT_51138 [Apiosordaria backusii]